MDLNLLQQPVDGWNEAQELILAIDEALAVGLSRLPEASQAALQKLSVSLSGSPLATVVGEAVNRLQRAEFSVAGCLGLAAARSALQGARYDALRQQVLAATGLTAAKIPEVGMVSVSEHAALLSGVQQWLVELAVAGFAQLTASQLAPFAAALARLQGQEKLSGPAVILTGFHDEMLLAVQQKERAGLPKHRWADLWCAAMLGTQALTPEPPWKAITGRFHPCGFDVREHRSCVNAMLWGLLETDGSTQVARLPFTAWKVSVVTGDELWRLFLPALQPMLDALAKGQALRVAGELLLTGDLRLSEDPKPDGASQLFTLPASWTALPATTAAQRHPVHLADLVRLEGGAIKDGVFTVNEISFPLALERLGSLAPEWDDKLMSTATDIVGLLRWDSGTWKLQPLAARGGGKLKAGIVLGQGIAARVAKLKTETLALLAERASRLLRA